MQAPPSKELPCLKCGATTENILTPTEQGCAWQCTVCKNSLHAYSHADMHNVVRRLIFGLPGVSNPIKIPEGFQVFLKHNGPDASEKEASKQSIERHVRLTGQLPQVGKPMFAGDGIPYGEVVRITQKATDNV